MNVNPLGKEIHRQCDEFGPILVFDDGHKRTLTFGNDDEQSSLLKHSPHVLQHQYCRGMMLGLAINDPQDIAIIGVGAGSLITAIHRYQPLVRLTGIELRRAVVEVAYKYFHMPRSGNIRILLEDGVAHLKNVAPRTYDLLIADMYTSAGLNPDQLAESFIIHCKRAITNEGWLILNYWLDHRQQVMNLDALKTSFRWLYGCDTGSGNWLVFASNQAREMSLNKHKLQEMATSLGFSLNGLSKRLQPLVMDNARLPDDI
jgi:spermidine synthase